VELSPIDLEPRVSFECWNRLIENLLGKDEEEGHLANSMSGLRSGGRGPSPAFGGEAKVSVKTFGGLCPGLVANKVAW
jgi:hypothetical protein